MAILGKIIGFFSLNAAKFMKLFSKATNISGVGLTHVTTFENKNILRSMDPLAGTCNVYTMAIRIEGPDVAPACLKVGE